ncbi:hypothetical protein GGX14DRAFT_472962 [Mycena pura]|uniref:C2H2-type domain-containing protein n=1 Tax=Mycena pura TaxID=153505 RepID=A0AAD6UWQ6_9AGAR|nr:hypothetical protein GGX14DRAFT_472962 [Mycena pura]
MNTSVAFQDLASYSLGFTPEDLPANVKRHAVYFPKAEDIGARPDEVEPVAATGLPSIVVDDDDVSTWEFHAPVASSTSRDSDSPCMSPYQTAAQEVVYRYRAGLKIDLGECLSPASQTQHQDDQDSSFDDFESSLDADSSISSISLPMLVQNQVKPRFRESRIHALLDIREEAHAVVNKDGLSDRDPVVCHRPGCRDTLSNMKALIYHLHVHNMHDRSFRCTDCGKYFEVRRHLTMHHCPKHATSCPSSPIHSTLMRVLTKITSR